MRKLLKQITKILAIGCIICSLVISAFAYSGKTLGITRYEQEKSKWCWIAAAQMVGKYKTGTKVSQTAICLYINNGVVENRTGYAYETTDIINYLTGKSTATKYSYLKYSTSQGQIDDNRPFVIGILKSNGRGHSAVVDGYKTDTYQYLRIVDPAEGCGKTFVRYHYMVNGGVSFESCFGTWDNTSYIVKGG